MWTGSSVDRATEIGRGIRLKRQALSEGRGVKVALRLYVKPLRKERKSEPGAAAEHCGTFTVNGNLRESMTLFSYQKGDWLCNRFLFITFRVGDVNYCFLWM